MDHDVFISYAQPNKDVAVLLHEKLNKHGLPSWLDKSPSAGIRIGKGFEGEIVKAIKACKIFVLIHSEYYNVSTEGIKEVRNAVSKKFLIFKTDKSKYSDDLSYHLGGLQYIDAIGKNLENAKERLVKEVSVALGQYSYTEAFSTDKALFKDAFSLLQAKLYAQAKEKFTQFVNLYPEDIDARFYLSISIINGRKTRKLDGTEVKIIEGLLLPYIDPSNAGHLNVLLALVKYGYYTMNGFIEKAPTSEQLLINTRISNDMASLLLFHINDPENEVWRIVYDFCRQ